MKLLFLANRMPYPPYRGDKLKIYNLAKRLCKNHELHLLTFTQTEDDRKHKPELEKIFTEVHTVHLPEWESALNCFKGLWSDLPLQILYFQSQKMNEKLTSILHSHSYNAIHVQHLRMAPYLSKRNDLPRILDLPDAFSLYWERRKKIKRGFLRALFEDMEQKRLLRFEAVIKEYQLALVCSSEDMDYLKKLHWTDNIRLLPNGVDLETFSPDAHDYSHNSNLLFTGNMDYAPNVDAVVYFAEEILPVIHLQFPDVKFIVAGQRPIQKILDLSNKKIIVTGFVKDLSKIYNEASVVVAPLRFGAGTQNKVLEAMAMGIPVVCSNIGFQGLNIQNGAGAIMQTDKNEFADAVCRLLASEKLRRELGTKASAVIQNNFDWDVIAKKLEDYFEKIA